MIVKNTFLEAVSGKDLGSPRAHSDAAVHWYSMATPPHSPRRDCAQRLWQPGPESSPSPARGLDIFRITLDNQELEKFAGETTSHHQGEATPQSQLAQNSLYERGANSTGEAQTTDEVAPAELLRFHKEDALQPQHVLPGHGAEAIESSMSASGTLRPPHLPRPPEPPDIAGNASMRSKSPHHADDADDDRTVSTTDPGVVPASALTFRPPGSLHYHANGTSKNHLQCRCGHPFEHWSVPCVSGLCCTRCGALCSFNTSIYACDGCAHDICSRCASIGPNAVANPVATAQKKQRGGKRHN